MCVLVKIIHSYGLDDVYLLLMTNIPSAQINMNKSDRDQSLNLHVNNINQSGKLITTQYLNF